MPPRHATCPSCQDYEFKLWDNIRASRKRGTRCPNCNAETQLKRRMNFLTFNLAYNAVSGILFLPIIIVSLSWGVLWGLSVVVGVASGWVLVEAHFAKLERA